MELHMLALLFISAYMLALLFVGWKAGRDQTHDGYVIGNREVGLLPTVASMGAGFRDAGFLSMWVGLSYIFGYGLFTAYVGVITGLICMAYIAPKVRQRSAERGYITASQMIEDSLGPLSSKAVSLLVIFLSIAFSAAQLYVIGMILSETMAIPPAYTICGISLIVCFYLWAGGYSSIIKTDTIQFFIILSLISVPFFIPISKEKVMDFSSYNSMGWTETIAVCLITFLGMFSTPDFWQRIFSAKDGATIKKALPISGIMMAALTFGLVVLGLYAQETMPGESSDTLFYKFFTLATLPDPVLAGIILAVFAMAMSTIDTQIYLFTSAVLEDFGRVDTANNRKKYIKLSRYLIIGALALITLLALSFENLISALMSIIGVYNVAIPAFFLGAWTLLRPSQWLDRAIVVAMAFGFIAFIYMHFNGIFSQGFAYALIPTGISIGTSILVCSYYKLRIEQKDS